MRCASAFQKGKNKEYKMNHPKLLQPVLGVILVIVFSVGCGVPATPAPILFTVTPTPIPPTAVPSLTPPPHPVGPQPMFPPDDPQLHAVYGATSIDGLNFTEIPEPLFRQASVPDVVEITVSGSKVAPKGTLLLYFVDFSHYNGPNQEVLSMATSTDGRSWSARRTVIVHGNNRPIAVDPSVVELPDGRLRLYYYGADFADPLQNQRDHEFFSAVSEDGINFQVEPGTRFQAPGITDPEVAKAGDEWRMVYLQNGILLARSRDGLEFKADKRFEFVPGSVLMPDGRVRAFGQSGGGSVSALYDFSSSVPEIGKERRQLHGGTEPIGDATCIRRLNGTYFMVLKKQP